MANKTLFSSITSKFTRANTTNDAGGRAYALPAKQALAQIAATGCFNNTYHTRGRDQLVQILQLVNQIDDNEFLARLAVYARKKAFMKDMPAALFVILSSRDTALTHKIFDQVVEIACGNIPRLPGPVVIGLDTSGSMTMPAIGNRGRGATSKMRCVDVAALFAAAIVRRNPDSVVVPFDTRAHKVRVDPGDTILSMSKRLSKFVGGGTDCSIPIAEANSGRLAGRKFAGIVLVSDNESWVGRGRYGSTVVMTEWNKFVNRQQGDPRLVCIDIQPSGNSQAPDRKDILNVGGFSDSVFKVVNSFLSRDRDRFVTEIEAIELS